MSSPKMRVITIEANSREEALAQLKEQLGGHVPSDVVGELLEFIAEKDRGTKAHTDKEPTRNSAELGDFSPKKFAERLRETPAADREALLTEQIVGMGAKFGLSREEALGKGNEIRNKFDRVMGVLGLLDQAEKLVGEPTPATDPIKDEFDAAMAKLEASGVTSQQLCHLSSFYQNQDHLVDSMQFLYHMTDGHKHRPSAELFKQLDDYMTATNTWVFDTCENAGVDPGSFGFATRAEWIEKQSAFKKVRQAVAKVLDRKASNTFA